MEDTSFFTNREVVELRSLYKRLLYTVGDSIGREEIQKLKKHLFEAVQANCMQRNSFDMNPIIRDMQTAIIVSEEIGMKGSCLTGIMLHDMVKYNFCTIETIREMYGEDVAVIIKGLVKTSELYAKSAAIESENFRNLLISFAEDMRVILIMIADRVNIMRQIKNSPNAEDRLKVANESAYLYAPLAHKLGLYKLKSELEDLSLKYMRKDTYYQIKDKLNETKASRDKYIQTFIEPIKKKLEEAGLTFDIKGRTKSIHSIWNKMMKQKTSFEGIYDLFAIRIIIDTEIEKEKSDCWQAYSIITDMYQPNPKRLRDWLSIPKSNGYESLHVTVMGPEGKWVEVQIRTHRMDDIAERGLAAHWKYKGIKGESGLDEWLTSVREALENAEDDSMKIMDRFKLDLYEDEVFVFTPKGDLFKLPKGATVLDFAFHIHSKLGCKCIGARLNGKNVQLRQTLNSGDQVEITTSNTQFPKQDWLNIVTTSKARNKIRQELKEMASKQTDFAKETLQRKFKNRKLEYDEALMMRLIKKLGFKTVTEFHQRIADETLDVNDILEKYTEMMKKEIEMHEDIPYRSAETYNLQTVVDEKVTKDDVLVIDQNLKGLDFKLAKCCSPIYGDDVFGFVTVTGGIKIHRVDCPNAPQMMERFGYRIVKARWAGKAAGKQYPITLRVIGHDDIGIVTNITSIISKEKDVNLRSIGINSNDGLFSGTLTVTIDDTSRLDALIKKLQSIKGVKQVSRN
ncbi:RelA/SpoT family protein [uncultured Bacteroides sp.]|uniref:RelA/SpoT family protein n=1 Tax=uncultured Bacteroides sp. TaxID=162156 RepID=UPI002AAB5660|nr:RelA/SpoT family protein [uncultured Bacteroides sp.]